MYKDLKGSYRYDRFVLLIDHVQGDPYASPSRMRLEVDARDHGFPEAYYKRDRDRTITLEDQVLRKFRRELFHMDRSVSGSGKSGRITSCPTGQKVLERIAVLFRGNKAELRFEMGFPARGRTILAEEMAKLLFDCVPSLAKATLFYRQWKENEKRHLKEAIDLCDDQCAIRKELESKHLVAFLADGSVLPRESGVSDLPMKGAVPFISCPTMRVEMDLPHRGRISGMGIPEGITTIVGGGYHGKSTLLKALEQGVYRHIAGDGREYVITRDTAMKIRAEDGRSINHTDISDFISHLPTKQDTGDFSTENASGSTSQAANLVEALEAGSDLLLIDEDTSATNFMIRDHMMAELVPDEKEPITPLLRTIRTLYRERGISFLIVVGSSGDYLRVSDHVIRMEGYRVHDATDKAREICRKYADMDMQIHENPLPDMTEPYPDIEKESAHKNTIQKPRSRIILPGRMPDRIKIKTAGTDSVVIDREVIDVRYLEQLCDPGQTTALGYILEWILRNVRKPSHIHDVVGLVEKEIRSGGLLAVTGRNYSGGHPVRPRRQEIYSCLNRYRSMKMRQMNLSDYDNKKIKVYMKDGSTFEGFAAHNSQEYTYCEFGIDAECLQICDYLIRNEEIERIEIIDSAPSIRSTEEDMAMIFSVRRSFSDHLVRWEDNELPDKYDHNCFEYSAQPTQEEFERALNYQKERGDTFIKLEGDFPLTYDFGLSSGITLTMQLSGSTDGWVINDEIEIKKPAYKDLKEIERKHYGPVYGEDFTIRNLNHLYEYLDYKGAYLGDKLVGAYYAYSSKGYTCVDGLIVDEAYRHRHIATTLLKHAVNKASGNVVFLHADADDTPREMYEKLGFREVDRLYEYLSTDIGHD